MLWKAINCPECNRASASLLFMHSGGFIHPDYHQPMNVILQGFRSCDVDVWRPLIAGMAWAMTSANSFTAGPTGRDQIQLQTFLWAQQWSAINKLTGFSTLDSMPTQIMAELQLQSAYKWTYLGGSGEAWPWKGCDGQNYQGAIFKICMLKSSGATKVYFHEEIMTDELKTEVPVSD